MRLVFVLSRVPWPLDKGDKLRAYFQMKELAKRHEITLIALSEGEVHKEAKAKLSEFCSEIYFFKLNAFSRFFNIGAAFLSGRPFQCGYFFNATVKKRISKLINTGEYDAAFFQLVRTAEYAKGTKLRKVIDYQDALSAGLKRRAERAGTFMRLLLKTEYKRMLRYERKIFELFDERTIITESDRAAIAHPAREEIHVIANGVDTERFYPREIRKKYDVIFAGNMSYPPNVDAAVFLVKEILDKVKKKVPGVKLLIAGANPAKEVLRLASDNVTVSGWVDDIGEAYASARVFTAPMRIGSGLQNKLLEAMATKLPAVTTPLANKALKAKAGKEIMIGETAEKLAENIAALLNDSALYNSVAQAGFDFVKKNYSWESTVMKLEKVLGK